MSKICWAGPKNFELDQNFLDMDQKENSLMKSHFWSKLNSFDLNERLIKFSL